MPMGCLLYTTIFSISMLLVSIKKKLQKDSQSLEYDSDDDKKEHLIIDKQSDHDMSAYTGPIKQEL